MDEFRGPSYLSANLDEIDHPAADLLREWRDHGVPAEMNTPDWTDAQRDEAAQRGCHHSATEHAEFLRDEMAEFIESRFFAVLPYSKVRQLQELRLSPAAVKDERDRKPRLLCDHSWPWPEVPSVNESTEPHAPAEAMQFGGTLPRILKKVRHANPKYGPPRLCKHDIKDGFYRMFLQARACLRLAILLPRYDGEEQLVAIPMSTTMGWEQSPPSFSVMSETTCDLANAAFAESPKTCPPHRLSPAASVEDDLSASWEPRPREPDDEAADSAMAQVPGVRPLPPELPHSAPPSNRPLTKPLGDNDVFVDDFIQIAQGGPRRMNALRNHLLHAIDQVLATPDVSPRKRNEAVSMKKLLKGDGSWATRKLILGWIIDTVRQTIELPPHRKLMLAELFTELANTSRVSNRRYQQILGKLRFVSTAIPGSAGLFCALQLALKKAGDNRVRITRKLRHHIDTFASLAASLCHRPTHLAEIVPQEPSLLGATDSAKAGMGGVYFDSMGNSYVWRLPYPQDVRDSLISVDNPNGVHTNSDGEHAAICMQAALMATTHDIRYATIATGTDNTPALSRLTKGAVSSEGPAALLCAFQCEHQRTHRYCHTGFFINGVSNVMADDASRLQSLTDTAFLAHFNQSYAQERSWVLLHPPEHVASNLISALRSSSPEGPLPPSTGNPLPPSSTNGQSSVSSTAPNHPCVALPATSSSTSSSCSSCATESTVKPVNLSGLIQWPKPSRQWARGSPTWVNRILPSKLTDPTGSIPYWLLSSKACVTKTPPRGGRTPSASSSSGASATPSTPTTTSLAPSTSTSSTSSWSPSTFSSARPNTFAPPTAKPALKPFGSTTSPSPWVVTATSASRHL